jgi:hypothetical protein
MFLKLLKWFEVKENRMVAYMVSFVISLIVVYTLRVFFIEELFYFYDVFFNDPSTVFFFFLVTTHNQIMSILFFIFVLVSWLLFIVLKNYGWFKSFYSKSNFFGFFFYLFLIFSLM